MQACAFGQRSESTVSVCDRLISLTKAIKSVLQLSLHDLSLSNLKPAKQSILFVIIHSKDSV